MIERELIILRETEAQARAILKEAEEKRLQILGKARRDAQRRHESIIQRAHGEGKGYLDEVISQAEANRKAHLHELDERIHRTKALGERRIEFAVNKILEGMWENGHRSNEQL